MDTVRTTVITDDGASLAVWASGPPDARAVLLLHGFSLDHTTWDEVAERLVEKGFRIVAADARGHGDSTLGKSPPTVDRLVADVVEIVAALELETVHLVGHSLGAFVALAARTSDQLEESVSSVTSIAGTERSIQDDPAMRVGSALFRSSLGRWLLARERTGRLMISTWFGRDPSISDLDRVRLLFLRCEVESRAVVVKATRGVDLRPTFSGSGPPTLIMCGRNDKAPSLKHTERIANSIAGSELVVIDSAGHMVMIEEPDRIVEHLSEWFGRV